MLWVLGNRLGVKGLKWAVLTGTVHLVTLVLTRCPAVTLPGHRDTLHLPTAAGKLPGAAALLWNTHKKRGFVWLNLHITKAFFLRRENHLNSECSSLNGAVWAFKAVNKIRYLRWRMGKRTIRAAWSRQKSSSPLLREYWHWDDLTQLLTRSKQKQ